MEKMTVLLVEPMERPRLVTINHTLEEMQRLVEGHITCLYPWEDPVGLVCDDEAILNGKMLNRALLDERGDVYDIVSGTFFICGLSRDDFAGLNDALAKKYMERFRYPEMFMRTADEQVVWYRMSPGGRPKVIF